MKIGYARVSTIDQNLDLQIQALQKQGCHKIYQEKMTGSTKERPILQECLASLTAGDVLVIYKLDRLGRSLKDLIFLVEQFKTREVGLVSLNDPIDTTTPQGLLSFHIFSALAEYERALISERTHAGLKAARSRGKKGGRPSLTPDNTKVRAAKVLHQNKELTIDEICQQLNVSRAMFYKYLKV